MTGPAVPVRDRPYARGVTLCLLGGVCWSTAGILLRNLEAAGGWQVIFYRSISMVALLGLYLALRYRGAVVERFRATGRYGILGALSLVIAYTGSIMAMLNTTIANALFIFAISPFLVALLGWLVLREAVRPRTWGAILAALCGAGIMVAEGLASGGLYGNLMALLMPLGFAGFVIALRLGRTIDMLPTVCLGGVFTGLVALMAADGLAVSNHDLAICMILGVVQVGFGMALFTSGSRHVPAAELGLLAMSEVVLGPIWVWLGVGEVPSVVTFAGGALVLGAIVAQATWRIRERGAMRHATPVPPA